LVLVVLLVPAPIRLALKVVTQLLAVLLLATAGLVARYQVVAAAAVGNYLLVLLYRPADLLLRRVMVQKKLKVLAA
jgi:hypothetical protein